MRRRVLGSLSTATSGSLSRSTPSANPLPSALAKTLADPALPSLLRNHHSLLPARAVPAPSTTVPESGAKSTHGRRAAPAYNDIRDRQILAKPRTVPLATTPCR